MQSVILWIVELSIVYHINQVKMACQENINISTFQSLPHFILWFYNRPLPAAVPGYRHLNWPDRDVMGTY